MKRKTKGSIICKCGYCTNNRFPFELIGKGSRNWESAWLGKGFGAGFMYDQHIKNGHRQVDLAKPTANPMDAGKEKEGQ